MGQLMMTSSIESNDRKIYIQFYFTSTMACCSETWYFGIVHVIDD